MSKTTKLQKRIEMIKLLTQLKSGNEAPGDTILRALNTLKAVTVSAIIIPAIAVPQETRHTEG